MVELVSSVEGRLSPGSRLATDEGRPLCVLASQLLPGRAGAVKAHWLVQFEGVANRSASEALVGRALLAEVDQHSEGLWVHQLIGSSVSERSGQPRGRVVSVQANPASDLLVLGSGALVPLRFVVSCQDGEVVVDVPEGLFDL